MGFSPDYPKSKIRLFRHEPALSRRESVTEQGGSLLIAKKISGLADELEVIADSSGAPDRLQGIALLYAGGPRAEWELLRLRTLPESPPVGRLKKLLAAMKHDGRVSTETSALGLDLRFPEN